MWKPKRHQSKYPAQNPGPFERLLHPPRNFTPMYCATSWDMAGPLVWTYEVSLGRELIYRQYDKVRYFFIHYVFEYFSLKTQRKISKKLVRPIDRKMTQFRRLTARHGFLDGGRIHINGSAAKIITSNPNSSWTLMDKNGWSGSLRMAEFYKDGVIQGIKCMVCGEETKLPFTDHGVFPAWKDWKNIHDIHRKLLSPGCDRGTPTITKEELNSNGAFL